MCLCSLDFGLLLILEKWEGEIYPSLVTDHNFFFFEMLSCDFVCMDLQKILCGGLCPFVI